MLIRRTNKNFLKIKLYKSMKIKDYLEMLPENINISDSKGLFGKELKLLEPYFESIEEVYIPANDDVEQLLEIEYWFVVPQT